MEKLLNTLDKMLEVMASLNEMMHSEQQQLSAGQVNSSLLQRITEDKGSLLSTLSYIDQLRKQAEQTCGMTAPYARSPEHARRWTAIQSQTLVLRDLNQHNGLLLGQQIQHTQQALDILKPHFSQKFYGPDGQARSSGFLHNKA